MTSEEARPGPSSPEPPKKEVNVDQLGQAFMSVDQLLKHPKAQLKPGVLVKLGEAYSSLDPLRKADFEEKYGNQISTLLYEALGEYKDSKKPPLAATNIEPQPTLPEPPPPSVIEPLPAAPTTSRRFGLGAIRNGIGRLGDKVFGPKTQAPVPPVATVTEVTPPPGPPEPAPLTTEPVPAAPEAPIVNPEAQAAMKELKNPKNIYADAMNELKTLKPILEKALAASPTDMDTLYQQVKAEFVQTILGSADPAVVTEQANIIFDKVPSVQDLLRRDLGNVASGAIGHGRTLEYQQVLKAFYGDPGWKEILDKLGLALS